MVDEIKELEARLGWAFSEMVRLSDALERAKNCINCEHWVWDEFGHVDGSWESECELDGGWNICAPTTKEIWREKIKSAETCEYFEEADDESI